MPLDDLHTQDAPTRSLTPQQITRAVTKSGQQMRASHSSRLRSSSGSVRMIWCRRCRLLKASQRPSYAAPRRTQSSLRRPLTAGSSASDYVHAYKRTPADHELPSFLSVPSRTDADFAKRAAYCDADDQTLSHFSFLMHRSPLSVSLARIWPCR